MALQVHLSWDEDGSEAERLAHEQWRTNTFSPPLPWDLDTPSAFEEASAHVRPADVHEAVRISSDLDQHAQWLREYAALGFDEIYLHHVGQEQGPFIEAFGQHVLPQVRAGGEGGR